MLTSFTMLVVFAGGVLPSQMADVVAQRLARLNQLVVEVDAELFTSAPSFSLSDRSSWRDPGPPGDGGRRVVRIVRPGVCDEGYVQEQTTPIVTCFSPGYSVRRAADTTRTGRAVYGVENNPVTAVQTRIPLYQFFDLQIQESWVPGLNTLRLLRDYPATLVGSDGDVSTYAVTVQSDLPGAAVERYEFDLNPRGTPLRFRAGLENANGSTCESETFTLATQEVNGAELVTEAVTAATSSLAVQHYGVVRLLVRSVAVDNSLTPDDVYLEPERRNAVIHTTTLDIAGGRLVRETAEFNESGSLVASAASISDRLRLRMTIMPAAVACGVATAAGVVFVSRRSRARPRE